MRKLIASLAALVLAVSIVPALAFEPDVNDSFELDVQKAIIAIKKADPGIETFFDNAAGFAVFPSVGKGGIVIGGAYGKGLVIAGKKAVGYTTMTQGTIGLQLGGQNYSQFIFFRDNTAIDHFKRGNFEFGAQASAVAVTAGASADAAYDSGVAIFTLARGGLMIEGSVGGQRFTYQAKP
ncbi:MAG: lipid-binding SYLF domain-containing protein [Xanthomonadales bacterium]|nr:lipid-binding SYLF domain-containing protein [Gammaproteobacteria bacterium]MBT8054400.1 lipid-binding SYLF domain-containing protein [Gammaproteobacteria bacterium]NND56436.1 lipid-binding SYLF domain-containing protein [Xanthomonadales bacterium]NNK51131.1 lipid-binding SYLF domain-containing protein [Xanthomonadales bacterium]